MTVPYEGKSDATTGAPASQPAREPSTESASSAPSAIDLGEGIGQVSLDEARRGYLRQSDYTKKTQALASERESLAVAAQLASALDASPAETLRALAEAYEVDLSGRVEGNEVDEDADIPPHLAAKLKEMEAELEQSRQYRLTAEEREVEALIDQQLAEVGDQAKALGMEVDEEELIQFALDHNLNDLSAAFLKMNSAKFLPPSTDLKRRLPGSRSGSLSNTIRQATKEPGRMSVREAVAAALDEHNVHSLEDLDLD